MVINVVNSLHHCCVVTLPMRQHVDSFRFPTSEVIFWSVVTLVHMSSCFVVKTVYFWFSNALCGKNIQCSRLLIFSAVNS